MIGKRLSPVLAEIENTLWEFESEQLGPPRYTDEGFRAACKIFMSALLDRMWPLQEQEGISQSDRNMMSQRAGEELRRFVKTYAGVDTQELYLSRK